MNQSFFLNVGVGVGVGIWCRSAGAVRYPAVLTPAQPSAPAFQNTAKLGALHWREMLDSPGLSGRPESATAKLLLLVLLLEYTKDIHHSERRSDPLSSPPTPSES